MLNQLFCSLILILGSIFIATPVSAAPSPSLYFDDFTADYYLEKTEAGSKLHVKEVLTAIFPENSSSHGITRFIPFANQGGKNRTVDSIHSLNFTVLRNGIKEPVAKTSEDDDEYIFYVGSSNSYVSGEQIYTLEYDMKNVITEFTDDLGHTFQELYWDTNGTGWNNKFNNLTARLHLPSDIAKNLGSGTSCYVGVYGSSGSERCTVSTEETDSETILTFKTHNLSSYENLTFAVDFNKAIFTIPEPPKNYTLVIITAAVASTCLVICLIRLYFYFKNASKKRQYYRHLFASPQYSIPENYHVAEAAELYLGKKEKTYVATLLELAVSKKISIKKGEEPGIFKRTGWNIVINDISGISKSQDDLLRIINGGHNVHPGEKINIKVYPASSTLSALSRDYRSDSVLALKKLELFEQKYLHSTAKASAYSSFAFMIFLALGFFCFYIFLEYSEPSYETVVGLNCLPFVVVASVLFTMLFLKIIGQISNKYVKYTTAGLDQANYLDGLYQYIHMAETDRMKFLQSVKGADTSPEGIVKLYEKLLPYACLFKCEESWIKAFGNYCKEISYVPNWYSGDDFNKLSAISSVSSVISATVARSNSYTSSSYGGSSSSGSSSSSSGSSGGGYSGGGGGGGGGGSW